MAIVAFLSAVLFGLTFTMTLPLTTTPVNDAVTVRRGEQLQMSCDIGLECGETSFSPEEVRWYRGPDINTKPYGLIIETSACGFDSVPCMNANTTDERGIVHFTNMGQNLGKTTLTIARSVSEDNTTFFCAVFKDNTQKSAQITVTVYYLPNTSYPTCTQSSPPLGTTLSELLCSSEITQPVVSLEWTTSDNSSKILLSNDSVIIGDQVQNTLPLHELDASYNNSIFTCYMTSEAYPGFNRNCFIGPVTISPIPTPVVTDRPTSQSSEETTESRETSEVTVMTLELTSQPAVTVTRTIQSTTGTTPAAPVALNVTVIAAAGAAVAVLFLILLIIIACLVTSRRKAGQSSGDELSVTYENQNVWDSQSPDHEVNRYVNYPLDPIGPIGPPPPPPSNFTPAPPTYNLDSSIVGLGLPGYAEVARRSEQPPPPEHAVLNSKSNEPSQEILQDGYAYSSTKWAENEGAALEVEDDEEAKLDEQGVSLPEYAVVPRRHQRQPPPPEYAVLNPESDESSEASAGDWDEQVEHDKQAEKIPDIGARVVANINDQPSHDLVDKPPPPDSSPKDNDATSGEDETLQGIAALDPDLGYAEIGPAEFTSNLPNLECLDASRGVEENFKDDYSSHDREVTEKPLCLVSPDGSLFDEKSLEDEDPTPKKKKKKKKDKEKARLDPF